MTAAGRRRHLALAVLVLALALGAVLAYRLRVAPRLALRRVVVESALGLPDSEILDVAGLEPGTTLLSLDVAAVEERLAGHPAVGGADVSRLYPDTLRIQLIGRRPVALGLSESEGYVRPLGLDRSGFIFNLEPGRGWDLPVLEGVDWSDVGVESRLDERYRPLLEDLDILRREEAALFLLISELHLTPRNEGDFETRLWLHPYPVRLVFGGTLDGADLKRALVVLDVMVRQGETATEIDLRAGDIVTKGYGEG